MPSHAAVTEVMDRRVKFPHDLVFHDMVKDGDPSEMCQFLKRPSVDPELLVNTEGGKSNPAFHQLVKDGNLKCIRMLVNLGADVNMKDEEGSTSLHHSVRAGNIAVTKFLLRSGANPDISNANGLMCELLWSDPQPQPGRSASKRGVGVQFGPDVTKEFCENNNLEYIIRSHEVKPEGYEVAHDGKCITVFSAPNYCDQMENKGAFITMGMDMKPNYTTYEAVPHPDVKPMTYANSLMSMFGFM